MSANAPDWVQLQHRVIAPRLTELTDGFMREITAGSDSESAKDLPWASTSFSLTQNEAAKRWKSAMVDDCVQLLAKHNRLGSPNLWQFLFIISKEEIAPRIQELLHASFRITRKDTLLIESWYGIRGSPADPGIGSALNIARSKQRLVDEIIDKLLAGDREGAFGVPAEPKFDVPSTPQINATTSPKAQPSQYGSHAEAGSAGATAEPTVNTLPNPSEPPAVEKLPAKKQDLSRYLDGANLTARQRECASLKFEYDLSLAAIARHLDLDRKTVDEHIRAAQMKMNQSRANEKHAKDKAKSGER